MYVSVYISNYKAETEFNQFCDEMQKQKSINKKNKIL